MRILTRYVLREFLVPLGYCLTGFISIYVLFELFGSFSRMMEAKLPLNLAVVYFCGYLAPYFHYLAPAALMLATLYTMWCFCRHSELIAMRASGVSFISIVLPLLSVSVVMALFVAYVSECYVPHHAQWAAQMKTAQFNQEKMSKADNIVFRNAEANRTWNVDKMLDDDGAHLKGVRVSIDRPNGGTRLLTITAEHADYLDGEWWLSGLNVQHHGSRGEEVASPTPEMDAINLRCYSEFNERPADFIMQNRPWKFNSVQDRLRYLQTHPKLTDAVKQEYRYDIWEQIMAPLACLIITLFAIPAGIASGRQSVFKGILGALGMFFSFYGLTIACMIVAKNGWMNPILGAVLPDVVFLFLGLRAFYRQR